MAKIEETELSLGNRQTNFTTPLNLPTKKLDSTHGKKARLDGLHLRNGRNLILTSRAPYPHAPAIHLLQRW